MQELLEFIHFSIVGKLAPPVVDWLPLSVVYAGGLFAASVVIIVWMSLIAMGWIWAERRVAGFIQARLGPNRVHWRPRPIVRILPKWLIRIVLPTGYLQSLADGIKLLAKEDIVPAKANRFLYELAPLLVFAGAFIPFVALPFSQHLVIADMDIGVFYILAFGALEVVGILMAGWAPNSKWTLYGGMRLAAQMLSYEIPLGLSVLTIVILAGSLNVTDIIIWQTSGLLFWDNIDTWWLFDWLNWGFLRSPATFIGFVIFLVAGLAETKRAPFDLPEAESELVSGFHTEYTGIRFSYFFLAEYCAMYVICLLAAVLFLGGWHWPIPVSYSAGNTGVVAAVAGVMESVDYGDLSSWGKAKLFLGTALWTGPIETIKAVFTGQSLRVIFNELGGFINLVGKSFVLLFIFLWVRWTLPRVRIDQVMHLCLKVLLPFGLACVVVAGLQAAIFSPEPYVSTHDRRAALVAEARERAEQRAPEPTEPEASDGETADESAAEVGSDSEETSEE